MKKILSLILLIFCLPVFANNSLQKQFESSLTEDLPIQDALYLINDDIKGYYSGRDSIYGAFVNLSKTYTKQNKKVDLLYLNNAINNLKKTYDKQLYDSLNFIEIDDNDYSKLTKDTKNLIMVYNAIAAKAEQNNIDCNTYKNKINESRNKFLADKNNIKQNYEIQLSLYDEKTQIDEYIKNLKSRKDYNYSDIENLELLSKEIESLCLDIYKYSYAYEKKKYQNWQSRNHKKVVKGTLQQFIYDGRFQPKIGSLYTHNPKDFYLIVKQTVPGGIIISGRHDLDTGFYTVNDIFLQTTKSYADGSYITEPIIAEYKGFYDYTTVLGVNRRIYKFYRYGQNEIDNNFKVPGEKFYFYVWDNNW